MAPARHRRPHRRRRPPRTRRGCSCSSTATQPPARSSSGRAPAGWSSAASTIRRCDGSGVESGGREAGRQGGGLRRRRHLSQGLPDRPGGVCPSAGPGCIARSRCARRWISRASRKCSSCSRRRAAVPEATVRPATTVGSEDDRVVIAALAVALLLQTTLSQADGRAAGAR